MIERWVESELQNWAAWCHYGEPVGPRVVRACASAEGRYRPTSDIGDQAEPPPPRPNVVHAEIVQRVYRQQLGHRERRLLRLRYVDRWSARDVQRLMRISPDMYRAALVAAARRVEEAFRSRP